jgi:coenzyme F420-reducing hydrogenase beta subunit
MAGFDIREMMNDIDEAPGKVWFWDLEKAVIDADRCVQCGVCVAACPTDSIGIGEDDFPELVKMCTGCSLCWDFCPRGGLQYESTWKITGGESVEGMGRVEEPICDFHGAALKGCDECADFMGHAADISVGSVGSADGYSSVLLRSEEGLAAFDSVRDRLELRPLDKPQALDKLDGLDKRVAFSSLKRAFDPDAPLFIDYEEHLNDYAGTDRAPVEHEAVRY